MSIQQFRQSLREQVGLVKMAKPIKWEQWMFDLIANTQLTAKEIAEKLGCSPHAVYQQRSKCGIRQWKKPKVKPEYHPASKYPAGYKTMKKYIMERDKWICAYCGEAASKIDHVVPKHLGGKDIPSNLVAACSRCNNLKGTSCANCQVWRQQIK